MVTGHTATTPIDTGPTKSSDVVGMKWERYGVVVTYCYIQRIAIKIS